MISVSSSTPNILSLSPEEFVQLPSPPRLLDVRTAFEYRSFHAPTALNLSMQRILLGQIPLLRNWVLPEWFRELPKNEPLAVVCLTAHRSPIAAKALVKAGFSTVFNITGGMVTWEKTDLNLLRKTPLLNSSMNLQSVFSQQEQSLYKSVHTLNQQRQQNSPSQ